MKLLLDANFLVLPFQFSVEIFEEFERLTNGYYELYTLERTLNEAMNIRDGRYRKLVKKLMNVKDIEIISTSSRHTVDHDLFEKGFQGFVVCTNDKELKRKLDKENLPYIFLRSRNHLEGRNLRTI